MIGTASRKHPMDPTTPKSGEDTELPSLELQHLWFTMLRRAWSSLVVIPAHAGGSAVSIARALAAVAERHRGQPVALITPVELRSLDELPTPMSPLRELEATAQSRSVALGAPLTSAESYQARAESALVPAHRADPAYLLRARGHNSSMIEQLVKKPSAEGAATSAATDRLAATPQVIVALDPVVSNPFGIPIALAADAALLCVTLGETPLASAKRTIEIIGRERFIGCVVVRHS